MEAASFPIFLNGLAPGEHTPCYGSASLFVAKDGDFGRLRATSAKALCAQCPVREGCADWALENDERDGIWGGLTPKERTKIREHDTKSSPRAECGTATAWRAHVSRGETCHACQIEQEERIRGDRLARLDAEHQKGGSLAGYRLELLLGLPTCPACRAARNAYYKGRPRTPKWYRRSGGAASRTAA
jgi:hypothetical protein